MKSEIVTVVDLGTSKTVCLAAQAGEKGGVQAVALATSENRGMRKGATRDAGLVAASVAEAVRKVENALGEQAGPLVVSIGGPEIVASVGQGFVEIIPPGRAISRDDVLKVVNHSRRRPSADGCDLIQTIPQSFRIDGRPLEGRPVGKPGTRLEVGAYMVSGPAQQIAATESAIREAGSSVAYFVLQPLASGLGVIGAGDADKGALVVDIGAGVTHIALFVDGALAYHDTLPIGSAHVTSDVAHLLKTGLEEADRLKLRYAAALARDVSDSDEIEVLQQGADQPRPMQRRVFCEIVQSRMREIANLSRASVERVHAIRSIGSGVFLTGGGSTMPGTDALFADVFGGVRVRVATPKATGPIGKSLHRPDMASVVGLAKFALDQGDDELATVADSGAWRERVRTLWALFGG